MYINRSHTRKPNEHSIHNSQAAVQGKYTSIYTVFATKYSKHPSRPDFSAMQLNILFLTLAGASLITAQQGLCDGSIISTDGSFGDNQLGNEICCQGDPNHGVGAGASTCTAGTPIPMSSLVSQTAATASASSSRASANVAPMAGAVWIGLAGAAAAAGVAAL
jgi:hypothetical protein